MLGLPAIMIMPKLLDIWLVEVPGYAVEFARLMIVQDILGNFSAAFYTPMIAANKIKKNSVAAIVLCVAQFSSIYVLFKVGLSPLWARYIGILFCIIWSFFVKPYILWKDINYTWKEITLCILRCVRALVFILFLCGAIYALVPQKELLDSLLVAILSCISVAVCSFFFVGKSARKSLINYVKRRLS